MSSRSRGQYPTQGSIMMSTAQIETQQLRIHLLEVQNRIQMLQQYRQQQRPANSGDTNYHQSRLSHENSASHHYQPAPPRTYDSSYLYGTSNMPSLISASMRQSRRTEENRWPGEENTYCELDSTDSSLCWSSYLMPVDYQTHKSGQAPTNTANSSLDLSAINELSIDELHTLEQSLETSLAEISSILPDERSSQPYSSFRNEETSVKLLPRNSTPSLHSIHPQTLSVHHPSRHQNQSSSNSVNPMPSSSNHQYASCGNPYRRNTISHPISSNYRQALHRPISVAQPVSSGEYSEYIQRLAFEGDSTNDSSVLDSTFTSYQRRSLSRYVQQTAPSVARQRPACIGQDSSKVTVQDLSTFTHVNDSSVQLEDPGSDTSDSEIPARVPSGDSNPDISEMTMDSDATCFMENPMCSRPVTYKQKPSRYKTMTNRLRKVGQQIKNKSSKNLKTLAVL